jgi:hypothetical protein
LLLLTEEFLLLLALLPPERLKALLPPERLKALLPMTVQYLLLELRLLIDRKVPTPEIFYSKFYFCL